MPGFASFNHGFLAPCSRLLTRFLKDRTGSSYLLVGAAIIPLMGAIGLAVDAGRGYLVKARLGDALDAATLAGAHEVNNTANFHADISMYFDANFPPDFMGAQVTLDPPVVSANNQVITISASAEVDTTFMQVLGLDTMTVGASTEVTRATVSMDVVLAIDMSGSMDNSASGGGTRIEAARDAANTLVDVLHRQATASSNLKIGLVPWNGKVNVLENGTVYDPGSLSTDNVATFTNPVTGNPQSEIYYADNSPVPLLRAPPAGWPGCVYARYTNNGNSTDDADHLLGALSVNGTDWLAWDPVFADGEDHRTSYGTCVQCARCLDHGITRLTDSRSEIEAGIAQLTAPISNTDIAQGLSWAWRAVTPGEPFDDASAFTSGRHRRAVVLLSDGEHYGRGGDGYRQAFGFGYPAGPNGMDARLTAIADSIKDQGVEIYAIQYHNDAADLATIMRAVATEPDTPYYYFAPDAQTLSDTFEEIATHLSELRLSR